MTNKIVLRSVEEFLTGYKPGYNPIMPMFLGKSKQYPAEAGKVTFSHVEAVGDLRGRVITPKDTEIHQVGAKEFSKVFKKYFLGAKYKQSQLQDSKGIEDVNAQVLDEHNKQADELLLGDANNSGLYTSSDTNYTLNTSYEVAKATDNTHIADLYTKMVSVIETANAVDGQKLVLVYGDTLIAKFNSMFAATNRPFASVLAEATEGVTVAKLPAAISTGLGNGFIVINLDQIELHYTLLPTIKAQGINEEEMYAWTNFLMGSSMVDVKAKDGIIRQPLTFAA